MDEASGSAMGEVVVLRWVFASQANSTVIRCGTAIAAVALATGVGLLLDPLLHDLSPLPLFFFAILLTARYCGLRPALLAVILSLLSTDYFLFAPLGSFRVRGPSEFVELLFCMGGGIGVAMLGAAMYSTSLGEGRKLREARESLAETEERLGLTLKSTGVSVWSWNILSNTIQGDENAAAQFGISLDQFPGSIEEFASYVHPDDRVRVQQEVAISIQHGSPYVTEFRTIWPDSSVHYLSTRGKVYRDATGNPLQFTGVCWDVTERWQAEENLRAATQRLAAEAKFRELLEAAPDAVVVVSGEGKIVLINAQAETLFGYSRPELLGQKIELLAPHRLREAHTGLRTAYFQAPHGRFSPAGPDLYILRKDGTELPVEISLSPLETENGKLVYSTIRDITERKRAERTREQLASIVDFSNDAIIGKTLEGIITNWNNGAERLYGYAPAEVLGKPISILLPPSFEDELSETISRLNQGEIIKRETVRRRKDGALIDVALTISPIKNAQGVVTAASAIARDISQRKRSEEHILSLNRRLEQTAAAAEAANRAKSTFLSTMSHEIRTPMNAILGYAQLMERDCSLSPEAKANLKIIGRSGEHLLALINDILDMAKIEAGRVELHPVTFNLSGLVDDLGAMFRLRARAKAIEFELVTEGESVPYVVADEGKTRQVLINLLGNAVKFTQFGRIALQVRLGSRESGQLWLSASIGDSGPGMTEAEQAHLFEPFCQPMHDLNIQQGTGLGLAISRKYARLMGGDITVSSVSGQGSTFRFEIPIGRGDAGVTRKRTLSGRVMGIRTSQEAPGILVVDDHPENRSWLVKLLTAVGFRVREADNGEAAIQVWEAWRPQLTLMDIHMPVMDGLEATRRIKASPNANSTVVIALTASAMQDDRRAVEMSGADDFLAKPCGEDALLEKIASHLHITYEYEQNQSAGHHPAGAEALTAERLRQFPLAFVEQLRHATLSGNKGILDKLISGISDSADPDAAQALQELVDRYDYDALNQLLEDACQR